MGSVVQVLRGAAEGAGVGLSRCVAGGPFQGDAQPGDDDRGSEPSVIQSESARRAVTNHRDEGVFDAAQVIEPAGPQGRLVHQQVDEAVNVLRSDPCADLFVRVDGGERTLSLLERQR